MEDEKICIDEMVNRFLGWVLPQDFAPDAGISFKAPAHPLDWPAGTNLLTANQAKAMFEHCLGIPAMPVAPQQPPCDNAHVAPGCEQFPE